MIAVGIFAEEDKLENFSQFNGLLHGGGFYLVTNKTG
jgi:hypothetical protein